VSADRPASTRAPARDVFRAPKGTHDVLPPASRRFAAFVDAFTARAYGFGYGLAVTPLFEHLEVFLRVGESTDIVTKEMYEFSDKGDRRLALRPEGTASVVRAFVEHRPTEPWKVFYSAPNFRYERPQKGRYRQHWQVGAEVIGAPDPDLDVEVVDLAAGFFASLGLTRVRLKLNSMGDAESRGAYVGRLREYLAPHVDALGDDVARMLAENPLRILDSKNPAVIDVIERAPQLPEHLSDDAAAHFEQVQAGLRALGIPFELEPRLVRGFDYYTGTTFEFAADSLDAAQDAIGGGGRYDGLAAEMGGPDVSGIGPCSRATPKGCSRPSPARSTSSSSISGSTPRHPTPPSSCTTCASRGSRSRRRTAGGPRRPSGSSRSATRHASPWCSSRAPPN
jgi:histidyl-tRNA synthetase